VEINSIENGFILFILFLVILGLGIMFLNHRKRKRLEIFERAYQSRVKERKRRKQEIRENGFALDRETEFDKKSRQANILNAEIEEEASQCQLNYFIDKSGHLLCGCLVKDWENPLKPGHCIKEGGFHNLNRQKRKGLQKRIRSIRDEVLQWQAQCRFTNHLAGVLFP